jgi:hypothetical protein
VRGAFSFASRRLWEAHYLFSAVYHRFISGASPSQRLPITCGNSTHLHPTQPTGGITFPSRRNYKWW